MREINIAISGIGLEELAVGMNRLAEALENLKAVVVVKDNEITEAAPESPLKTEAAAQEPAKKPAKKSTVKSSKKEVTLDDVRAKFRELAQKGHKNELKTLLAEYGVENVSALDESVFAEVLERLGEIG